MVWGRERLTPEEFEALPTREPMGYHVHWRELRDGRWVLRYKGTSCGMPFQTASAIVVVVRAA